MLGATRNKKEIPHDETRAKIKTQLRCFAKTTLKTVNNFSSREVVFQQRVCLTIVNHHQRVYSAALTLGNLRR